MVKNHDCREELRAAGSKVTPGRLALLRVLEREHVPLTVADMRKKLRTLNPVTVYRALDTLVQAGLVRKGIDERVAHFEYAGKPHHHHMVCVECGFIQNCKTC